MFILKKKCCHLRQRVQLQAIITMVLIGGYLLAAVYKIASARCDEQGNHCDEESSDDWEHWGGAAFSVWSIIILGLLLSGLRQNRPSLIMPCLMWGALGFVFLAYEAISTDSSLISASQDKVEASTYLVIVTVVLLGNYAYMYLNTVSLYREVKELSEHPSTLPAPGNVGTTG